eukprot:CAMPEP_0171097440 /NCGR_PEP_ID=MMETSP0766_2-20121228/47546_1 /TAXON_ID=439317 /ORGANISM="Gambierdiscus australes, Strain CAWD 149" /LENGTH=395 /DNA_ID=CAMNT_0011556637 /DNA_START=1 /DNA_END=1188 /DNA_ORIENTATION=-
MSGSGNDAAFGVRAWCRSALRTLCSPAQGAGMTTVEAFSVPSGPLAGSYDAVLITTDIEPDDIVALKVLAPRLRGVELLVVVGEGDKGKCQMAAEMLACYSIGGRATVVQSRRSKEQFPEGAMSAFHSQVSGGVLPATFEEGAVDKCKSFLTSHASPLALILKPPQEFLEISEETLGKTTAAAYGSFNFARFRDDVLAGPCSTGEQAARCQEKLIGSFKKFLWVERSLSVGREACLNCHQPLWEVLSTDAGLIGVVREWNAASVRRCAQRVADMCEQLIRDVEQGGATEATFEKVEGAVAKSKHSIAILQEIAGVKGNEICLADPLVAAALVDDTGDLVPFLCRARVNISEDGRPQFVDDESSQLAVLRGAESRERQEALMEVILRILLLAMRTS